jgi:NTP pyrophosphatase (non-canonical NTP hydrolase)
MSNNTPISPDLLRQFQSIHAFFRHTYPENTHQVEILARLSKISEELGELTNEVHDYLGFHKASPHKHSDPTNLSKEWADLFNTVILMGMALDIDMNQAVIARMADIFQRYQLNSPVNHS